MANSEAERVAEYLPSVMPSSSLKVSSFFLAASVLREDPSWQVRGSVNRSEPFFQD